MSLPSLLLITQMSLPSSIGTTSELPNASLQLRSSRSRKKKKKKEAPVRSTGVNCHFNVSTHQTVSWLNLVVGGMKSRRDGWRRDRKHCFVSYVTHSRHRFHPEKEAGTGARALEGKPTSRRVRAGRGPAPAALAFAFCLTEASPSHRKLS